MKLPHSVSLSAFTVMRFGVRSLVNFCVIPFLFVTTSTSGIGAATTNNPYHFQQELSDALTVEKERPLLQNARRLEQAYGAATMDDPHLAQMSTVLKKFNEFMPALQRLQKDMLISMKPVIDYSMKLYGDNLKVELKNYPWTFPCIDYVTVNFINISAPTNIADFRKRCMTPTQHPNAILSLVLIGRATDRIMESGGVAGLAEHEDELEGQMELSIKNLLKKNKVVIPEDADTEELIELLKQVYLERFSKLHGALDPKQFDSELQDLPDQNETSTPAESYLNLDRSDRVHQLKHISEKHKQAILTAEDNLKNEVKRLPIAQFCEWNDSDGKAKNASDLETYIRNRFRQKLYPALDDAFLMFNNRKVDASSKHALPTPAIHFMADTETRNHADGADKEIIVGGRQINLLCRAASQTIGKFPFHQNAFGLPNPSTSQDLSASFERGEIGFEFGVLRFALATESANEDFIEGIDFLVAHEYSHIALDTDEDLENMPRRDIEFRADMLAAAVVDAAHPASTLAYCHARVDRMQSPSGSGLAADPKSMVDSAVKMGTPGPAALMQFANDADYEKGPSYPSFEDRFERLNASLYNLEYWGTPQ